MDKVTPFHPAHVLPERNQGIILLFYGKAIIPAEAVSAALCMGKLNEYLKEILVKCTMCKPEEVHDLYTSMAQEYMNRGGQAVMDEQMAAWDAAHPAN